MEIRDKIDHPLALKVMRLTKPTMTAPMPIITCEPKDLPNNLFVASLKADIAAVHGAECLNIGQFLVVPQSFGSIYLGETFSCYVCVRNDSQQCVQNVALKADLQTDTQQIALTDGKSVRMLEVGETLDSVVQHEVKEIGPHILICEVSYGEGKSFRKFFKFPVLKPLDVKTNIYAADSDDVYLEVQIENTTANPICMEKVALESSPHFRVTDLNSNPSDDADDPHNSVFGKVNILEHSATRQYLYCLTPHIRGLDYKTESLSIGVLDIIWRSTFGERGHLQTSALQTVRTDHGSVRLSLRCPSVVFLEQPFQVTCKISNISDKEATLTLTLEDTEGVVWCGLSGREIRLKPAHSTDVNLSLVAVVAGVLSVGGVRIRDGFQRSYEFDRLAQIYALQALGVE